MRILSSPYPHHNQRNPLLQAVTDVPLILLTEIKIEVEALIHERLSQPNMIGSVVD